MFTPDQQKTLNHMDKGNVHPFNPESENIFNDIKQKIQFVLGSQFEVLHRGSSALGIDGQKEVDIYIPVYEIDIDRVVKILEQLFAIPPKSVYVKERIKFLQEVNGIRVEIMVVNKEHNSWIEGEDFFQRIKSNNNLLEEYRSLKKEASAFPYKDYQNRKVAFFNKVIGKTI